MRLSARSASTKPAGAWLSRRLFAGAMALGGGAALAAAEPGLTLAISQALLPEANLSDARASMQIWLSWANREHNMPVHMAPGVFIPSAQLLGMIRAGQVDAFALDVLEYRQVTEFIDPRHMIGADYGAGGGDEYVLLVRQDADVKSLADLKGKRLVRHQSPTARLVDEWLAVQQARAGLPADLSFWGAAQTEPKSSRVILPVFFKQADACVATRRAFTTMAELNPQVSQRLKVLASSQRMQTGGYFFQKTCPPAMRDKMLEAFSNLHKISYGQQVLTLFQSPPLVTLDTKSLQPSIDLLKEYERVMKGAAKQRGAGQ